ncbi:MAG TPA: SDR family oxidoreductase [Thermodesulfovibrionales bacterium]|nr:SDR family oxidoreductase [Thermodesulfovibrionales bacterium]
MKNKVVFITGSSNGIGRETALKFASEKARVAITYHSDRAAGQKTKKRCTELGSEETLLVRLDLMDNKSIVNAVDRVVKAFGKIDILINNAGVAVWRPLAEQDFADIERQVRTNLEGLVKMTRACLPHVKEMIINIASGAGQQGFAELAPYCATKFGVRGFTQALAEEISAPRIYAVNPDMTKTRLSDFQGRPPEEVAQIVLNSKRRLQKEDGQRYKRLGL